MRTSKGPLVEFMRPKKPDEQKASKRFYVVDLESKHDAGQEMGFQRPFLAVLREPDGTKHYFRDDPEAREGNWEEWPTNRGGCIDKLMNCILDDPNTRYVRALKNQESKPGAIIFAHGGGRFDFVHLLHWFRNKTDEYEVEIIPAASGMIEMTVRRIAMKRGRLLYQAHHRVNGKRLVGPKGRELLEKGEPAYRNKKRVPEDDVIYSYAHQKGACWKFRDSLRVLSGSLDNIARDFGIPGKQEIDLNLHEDDPSWDSYCGQDCDALAQILEALRTALRTIVTRKNEDGQDVKEGVEIGMTIGATGMDLFRRYFLKDSLPRGPKGHWIGIPRSRHFPSCGSVRCNGCGCENCICGAGQNGSPTKCKVHHPHLPMGCAHQWFMMGPDAAFHGGRSEVFWTKWNKPNLRYFDANSMYASMMLKSLPVGRVREHYGFKTHEDIDALASKGRFVFIEADMLIPEDVHIPPLPVVLDDKLCFPVGKFRWRGAWCEARHLKEIGGKLLKIHKVISYHSHPVLAEFSRTIFEGRRAAKAAKNACMTQAFKLIGNASGFGKFCQSPLKQSVKHHERGEVIGEREKALGERPDESPREAPFVISNEYREADFFLPQLAAGITALARETLWCAMQALENSGCTVCYCDTDSIIFAAPKGFDVASCIPVGDELGQWKDEMTKVTKDSPLGTFSGIFPRPKQYELHPAPGTAFAGHGQHQHKNNKRLCDKTCKGCSKTIIHWKGVPSRSQTSDNFEAALRGEAVDIGEQPPSFREYLRKGKYETRMIRKSGRGEYDKRELWTDGSTTPWVLPSKVFGQEPREWIEDEEEVEAAE